MDKNNTIYGHGCNREKQLGVIDDINKPEPCIIYGLQSANIIDIRSTLEISLLK